MIRVAHVVEDLKMGGIERVIENIALSLDPRRFKVYVVCLSRGGEVADRLIERGRDIEVLNITNYHSPASIFKVARWLRYNGIDILHTHAYPAGVLGRMAGVVVRIPRVFHHLHTTQWHMVRRHCRIERGLARFSTRIICCSEAVKESFLHVTGIRDGKTVVIYNGVEEPEGIGREEVLRLKDSLQIPRDVPVIGVVASLVPHKGHRYLIEAFKAILSEGIDSHLIIVGDGPLRGELKGLVSSLGLEGRVSFTGLKPEVAPYIAMMDVVVLPSCEREGLGLSLIEAMAMSKPVVATRIGGIPEVVEEGVTGLLTPPKDPEALAGALKTLLRNREVMREMGLKGRERYLQMFTSPRMITAIERLYGEV